MCEIFCNLESDIQIPISINLNDDILFNVKFYKYTISHLCLLLPSSFPIIISIYGDKNETFIVNYSGETLPFTVNSEEQFYLPNLKIIVQLKLLWMIMNLKIKLYFIKK